MWASRPRFFIEGARWLPHAGIAFALLLAVAGAPPLRAAEPAAVAPKPAAVRDDYRIQPADILDINVFQELDLKSTLRVAQDGNITLPLVGLIAVGGMTPGEAGQAIRAQLAKGYLINPQVTVTVMEFSKRHFTVLGEVQKPGSYDMPDQQDVTVLQAIGMAGGYTRIANPGKVTLMRKIDGLQRSFALNAKRMAAGNAESAFKVRPDDVITVAESRF